MIDRNLVIAYHGCDITTRDDLVAGRTEPKESKNKYDWLGPGFYFFENDPVRALQFAQVSQANPQAKLTAKPIATPSVVGCVISIQRCLDMTTQEGIGIYRAAIDPTRTALAGKKIPENKPVQIGDVKVVRRNLDNAVFTFIHELRDASIAGIYYQAVRGAYLQGDELDADSELHDRTHIQIALRDFSCVVSWFLPRGEKLLTEDQYRVAKGLLAGGR